MNRAHNVLLAALELFYAFILYSRAHKLYCSDERMRIRVEMGGLLVAEDPEIPG